MILMSVFESIKRECFPFPRGWVMGHCSVGDAGRDSKSYFYINFVHYSVDFRSKGVAYDTFAFCRTSVHDVTNKREKAFQMILVSEDH
jgi:hypothetical protein